MSRPFNIGANAGGLARHQSEHVAHLLREAHGDLTVHLELVTPPEGTSPLHDDHIAENRSAIGVLHELLRDREVDVVVHRGFDLRDQLARDLVIGAVPLRDSPYEAMLSSEDTTLDELEEGQRVGVVQLRSRAQILEHRPDLRLELVPGDVGHWLTALIDEDIDALIGPNSAFERLGLQERVTEIFPPEMIVPAPASGILVCVSRADDEEVLEKLAAIHHVPTAHEYDAEMAFVQSLGAQWEAPIGALAQCRHDELSILGLVASPSGEEILRRGIRADLENAMAIGAALGELFLEEGAAGLLHDTIADEADSLSGMIAELTEFDDVEPGLED